MNRAISCLWASAALLALGACAGAGSYPSLAIRDAERVRGTAEPVAPQAEPSPAPPVSPDLDRRIAQLVSQAEQAHSDFTGRAASATRTVAAARGARSPADGWVRSQVALADLQALRSNAMIALADLDELFAQERLANSGALSPAGEALSQARDRVGAWVDEENRTLARLAGQIAG